MNRSPRLVFAATALSLFGGCGDSPATPKPTPAAVPAAPTPEVLARLAEADAADGKVDKVVHKCAGCSLHMDGLDDKKLMVGDYEMHFCKDGCLEPFQRDPNGQVLAKVPQ
jgi:hypothetical protein